MHHIDHRLKFDLFSRWLSSLFLLYWLRNWFTLRLSLLTLDPRHLILQTGVVLLLHNRLIILLIARTLRFFFEAIREIRIMHVNAKEGDEVMMRKHIYPLRALLQ